MKRILFALFALLFILAFVFAFSLSVHAQKPSQQDTLNQYVSDLQKNPGDYDLREKIIKLVQTMKPAPAVPEEAERFMARATAAVKGAKTEKDFHDAAAELKKASLHAPWLPEIYYNLGVTEDKAGKYNQAIKNLKLYLVAAPEASDSKAVKNLIYEIEYRQEKAAKASSPEALAAKKQEEYLAWLGKIDGARYTRDESNESITATSFYEVHGNQLTNGVYVSWCSAAGKEKDFRCTNMLGKGWWVNPQFSATIENREASWLVSRDYPAWGTSYATISEDGATLSVRVSRTGNDTTYVFRRSR